MSFLCCFILVCALNFAISQPPESVFRQLSAAELREISLRQSPELLELAARSGESVTIIISAAEQGAIVQENVNTILDCTPWASNFPGGSVEWYKYVYGDLDHTMLGDRTRQDPEVINTAATPREMIRGDYNQIYEIIRTIITDDAEDPSRGVYECEVCVARGIPLFEECHSAFTTLAIAGRPPIIDKGTGSEPDMDSLYRIGQTVCLSIHQNNADRNVPLDFFSLQCARVQEGDLTNLPPVNITWSHTSEDGRTAFYALDVPQEDFDVDYIPPMEFQNTFRNLTDAAIVVVQSAGAPTLLFDYNNISRSSPFFPGLREAFGTWKCSMTNALGMDMATTLITDDCGTRVPSISRDCSQLGPPISSNLYVIDDSSEVPVVAGCNVCITGRSALTLTCPTNVELLDDIRLVSRNWTKNGDFLSMQEYLTVVMPGMYTCRVVFDNQDSDSATTSVSLIPDVEIMYTRGGSPTSGCDRLLPGYMQTPDTVCVFFDDANMMLEEPVAISCATGQENITARPVDQNGMDASYVNVSSRLQAETVVTCEVTSTNPDVNTECSRAISLTIRAFDPAHIRPSPAPGDGCTVRAGELYGPFITNEGVAVTLCCDAFGFPDPDVTWSRIVYTPSGFPVEVSLRNSSRYMIDPSDFQLTIPDYNETLDAGTYVCRAMNVAGRDVASVGLTSRRPTPVFQATEWSECEPKCIDGRRTRRVWCELDGVVVPDAMCCAVPPGFEKPPSVERCTNVPGLDMCYNIPLWKTGEFTPCSGGCQGGVRYRRVYCASLYDGSQLPDQECAELYGAASRPPTYDICYSTCCTVDKFPEFCSAFGTRFCNDPRYQQNCCWTCGLTSIEY